MGNILFSDKLTKDYHLTEQLSRSPGHFESFSSLFWFSDPQLYCFISVLFAVPFLISMTDKVSAEQTQQQHLAAVVETKNRAKRRSAIHGFQSRDFFVMAIIMGTTEDRTIEHTVSAFNWFEGKWLAVISPWRKSSTMLQKQVF